MNPENGLPLLGVRKCHKKDLVETSLSQYLRRQKLDDVGSGRDKDKRLLFLHPRQERGEDSRLGSPSGLLALNADACFNLVNPEHGRRNGLSCLESYLQSFLGVFARS